MIPWLAFERRWRDELCAAAIPRLDDSELPGFDGADTDAFWARFHRTASPTLRDGFRAAVWVLTLSSLARRRCLFGKLPPEEQDARLVASLEHRWRLVRDLTELLRLVACMAYFDDHTVRATVTAGGER